jgi:LPXTG-site transpeptidase (sortase) family protein
MRFHPMSRALLRVCNLSFWAILLLCLGRIGFPALERAQGFVHGWQSQRQLENQWQQARQWKATPRPAAKNTSIKKIGAKERSKPILAPTWPLTRLICERMNLDATVVEGVSEAALARGPGHDPKSSFLGQGNCVIAAHRNMAGWWFYRLDALRPGDRLSLVTPNQIFTYKVEQVREIPASNASVLRAKPGQKPRLTLYSCTLPKTDKRLVATAELQSDG